MTDQATAGAADAGTPEAASAPAATGSHNAGASDIFSGLQDAESRKWVESKGFKSIDPLVESARHADRLQAEIADFRTRALTPPRNDAPAEEWQAFYARLGRPAMAEEYEFKLPDGLPETVPYDAESAKAYKQWSFDAGLTPKQAQTLHDNFVRYQAGQYAAAEQAARQQAEAAHGELVRAWGDQSSASFKVNVQLADRFIRNNGGEALLDELKGRGLLGAGGEVLSPLLAQALAKAGKAYTEDGLATGSQAQTRGDPARTLYPNDPFSQRG